MATESTSASATPVEPSSTSASAQGTGAAVSGSNLSDVTSNPGGDKTQAPVSGDGKPQADNSPGGTAPDKSKSMRLVNDVAVHVATANGSGSQSSNNVLIRSIFQMGVPVGGKNLFPSNIQGEPTWFTIRANGAGHVARKKDIDILVAMNPRTAVDDVQEVRPGAVCICPTGSKLTGLRSDVTFYEVPFDDLAKASTDVVKLRKLLANMVYVGVLGWLLELDGAEVEKAIARQFAGKQKAIDTNVVAYKKGREWAAANLKKVDFYVVERMDATRGKILIDGNAAAALGCLFGGATVVPWYPITPSSSLCESLSDYLEQFRKDADGKQTYAVVQAEDEMAAIGMAVGAGWAGARAMTATSGPGISLMAEITGLAYFAEIPVVIFDVQRAGPSTGLPTRTSQADLSFVYGLSHGDTRHIVLLPGTVEECYTMGGASLDLAERYQTPVFVLSDLDLGMNLFMSNRFNYPDKPLDRGKVLTAADLTRLGKFERYRDVDGDGIPYRTLPGTDHPLASYFTRGSGHNEKAGYTEKPSDYRNLLDRLDRKIRGAASHLPAPEVNLTDGAKVGIIAFGSTHLPMEEARGLLTASGVATSYLRVRALPLADSVRDFVAAHDRIYVVEQNRDGQMREILTLAMPALATKLRSIRHYNGLPIHARFIADAIGAEEGVKS